LDPVPRCLVSPGVGAWCNPEQVTPTAALVWQGQGNDPCLSRYWMGQGCCCRSGLLLVVGWTPPRAVRPGQ
jgi:hypothetical protein